jgi:hypothetical protein
MNIGCVIYTKNFTTGEIVAKWSFDDGKNIMEGTGIANGMRSNDYVGDYKITYYDNDKNNIGDFDLVITKDNNSYKLKWYKDQILKFTGVALLVNSHLTGGWKPV